MLVDVFFVAFAGNVSIGDKWNNSVYRVGPHAP